MIARILHGRMAGAMVLSLVCLGAVNTYAQVSSVRRSDGASISTTTPKASPVAAEALPAAATLIYSNFGPKGSLYDGTIGWTEAGAEANDFPIAEAMSFVPASDFLLLRVDVAFTYVQGTNGVHLVIAEDNGGVPGTIIYHTSFVNLPAFGTCCTVETVKLTPTKTSHVVLKGGATYWIYPIPNDTTGYFVWNWDVTGAGGNGAVSKDSGQTWSTTTLSPFGAFDLYGSVIAQ